MQHDFMAWKGSTLAKGYPEFTLCFPAKSFEAVCHTQEFCKIEGSIDPVFPFISICTQQKKAEAQEQLIATAQNLSFH